MKIMSFGLAKMHQSVDRTDAKPFLSDVFPRDVYRKAESAGNGVLSSGEKNFSVHKTYMNFSRPCKRAPETALYALRGRSMVEMLGVLAIIGVLSVGAIAGYQKAMFKYKLNKQTEQLNTFFNATARHLYSFSKNYSGQNLTTYFIKMGEIPSEMIRKNVDNSIYDIFGTQMYVTYSTAFDALTITLAPKLAIKSMDNLEICKNIIMVARENSGSIYTIDSVSDWGNDDVLYLSIYGDRYCDGNKKCLHQLSLDDIYELCMSHINKKDAHLKVIYRQ